MRRRRSRQSFFVLRVPRDLMNDCHVGACRRNWPSGGHRSGERPSPGPNCLHDETFRRGRQGSEIPARLKPEFVGLRSAPRENTSDLREHHGKGDSSHLPSAVWRVALRGKGITGRTAVHFMQNRPYRRRPGNGPAAERSIVRRLSPLPVGNLTDLSIRPKFSSPEPYSGRMGSLPMQTVEH